MGRKTKKVATKKKASKTVYECGNDNCPGTDAPHRSAACPAALRLEMPAKNATEAQLLVALDVSGFSSKEITRLTDAIGRHLCDKETAHSDGHPGIDKDPHYTLRTMRYVNGELAKIDERELGKPDAAERELAEPQCPKCGEKATGARGLCVKETYDASNPIVWDEDDKTIKVESAWHNTENFGDGNGDYSAYCMKCGHETSDLEAFGLLDGEWDWD